MRHTFNIDRLGRSALWLPHQQMGQLAGHQRAVVGGDGVYVTLDDGRRRFDASAALWYANIGHDNAEVAAQLTPSETAAINGLAVGDARLPSDAPWVCSDS
jgi:adenosylmethionine-8-amino-7-oxononanoate aminotransferase